jgi:hypothetical protein
MTYTLSTLGNTSCFYFTSGILFVTLMLDFNFKEKNVIQLKLIYVYLAGF